MALAVHDLAGRLQRRHTVYVSSFVKDVFLRGRKLVLALEDEERETPLEELRRFVLLGKPSFGSAVLYVLLREGVPVDWLDRFGRPLGLLTPVDHGDGAIRLEQARFSTSPADTLALARKVICAKIDNVADLIRRREPMPSGWKFTRARAEARSCQCPAVSGLWPSAQPSGLSPAALWTGPTTGILPCGPGTALCACLGSDGRYAFCCGQHGAEAHWHPSGQAGRLHDARGTLRSCRPGHIQTCVRELRAHVRTGMGLPRGRTEHKNLHFSQRTDR